ncbi:hypothetical protein OAU06_03570 [Acidimicrobiia bacterium]|nr:hypothetical protein [Acidimicrobiia bacterium]
MKYKSKAWIGLLVIATLGWPILAPEYRPGQVILATGFAYIAVRFFGKVLASGSNPVADINYLLSAWSENNTFPFTTSASYQYCLAMVIISELK